MNPSPGRGAQRRSKVYWPINVPPGGGAATASMRCGVAGCAGPAGATATVATCIAGAVSVWWVWRSAVAGGVLRACCWPSQQRGVLIPAPRALQQSRVGANAHAAVLVQGPATTPARITAVLSRSVATRWYMADVRMPARTATVNAVLLGHVFHGDLYLVVDELRARQGDEQTLRLPGIDLEAVDLELAAAGDGRIDV